jgi:hypothetical protein
MSNPGKIYSQEEIEQARQSPSFPREYECRYLGLLGNCFRPKDIEYAVNVMGVKYNPDIINRETAKSIGCDPAWGGSSKFGLVVTELTSGEEGINVLLAEEYGDRPSHEDMLQRVLHIIETYGNVRKIYVDSTASAFITSLKEQLNERTDWVEYIKYIRTKYKWSGHDYYEQFMNIVPVVFSTEHKNLLTKTKIILEH